MKAFVRKYLYILIGFSVSLTGYLLFNFMNIDLVDFIYYSLQLGEKYELDELILFSIIFLISLIINVLVIMWKNKFDEKRKIYASMLYASNHILRNFLCQSQIIKIEAEENITFNKETIRMFEKSTNEAETLIKKLSSIKQVDARDIYESIKLEMEN